MLRAGGGVLGGMENEVIDVRTAFPQYRWRPTQDHRRGEHYTPWNVEIACRYGAIYAYGKGLLVAWVGPYTPILAKRLAALPGIQPIQIGDYEAAVAFDPFGPEAEAVLALIRPCKARHISPEHANKLQEAARKSRSCLVREAS